MNRLRQSSIFSLLVVAFLAGAAAARDVTLDMEIGKLENGLTYVLIPSKARPIVHGILAYDVGSKNEKPGRSGFAHLFEHLLFEGTKYLPKGRADRITLASGGNGNGFTSNDVTAYFENVPSRFWKIPVFIESDRMGFARPTLERKEILEEQRGVILNERKSSVDNQPGGKATEELYGLIYPEGHPYSWPVIGHERDIRAATHSDVMDFFGTYYHPNRAVFILVGDFNMPLAKQAVIDHFSELPRGPDAPPLKPDFDGNLGGEKRKTVEDPLLPSPQILIAYPTPGFGETKAWYAASLAVSILGQGEASKLHHALVSEKELAYATGVSMNQTVLADHATFLILPADSARLDQVESEFDATLDRFLAEGPTAQELEILKIQAEFGRLETMERFQNQGIATALYATVIKNPQMINQELPIIRGLSGEDILRAAKKHLRKDNRVIMRIVPGKAQ